MTQAWGIVATVKAPAPQVLAFAAHHLGLGAARIWLHFDDPEDPAQAAVAGLAGVEAVACTPAYWRALAGRVPARHQQRQTWNAGRIYAACPFPWLLHIDVDEFLWPARPVAEVLAAVPPARPVLRVEPWEALHDPALPDDIFTARAFRAPLRGPRAALRAAAFGDHAPLLPEGVLSHHVGKSFFRTGVAGLSPRIHGAFLQGERLDGGPFAPDIALLHFHAHDPARWLAAVAFRREKGAYSFNPALADWLGRATAAELAAFHDRVQRARPEVLDALRAGGALIEAELGLKARVEALGR